MQYLTKNNYKKYYININEIIFRMLCLFQDIEHEGQRIKEAG